MGASSTCSRATAGSRAEQRPHGRQAGTCGGRWLLPPLPPNPTSPLSSQESRFDSFCRPPNTLAPCLGVSGRRACAVRQSCRPEGLGPRSEPAEGSREARSAWRRCIRQAWALRQPASRCAAIDAAGCGWTCSGMRQRWLERSTAAGSPASPQRPAASPQQSSSSARQ